MRTVYSVRVTGPRAALLGQAVDRVTAWLDERHPYDERGPGVSVTVSEDPGWRRFVVDQHVDATTTSQIVVALRADARGLSFGVRQSFVPRQVRVSRRAVPRHDVSLSRLVGSIVDLVGAVDAGVPVASSARTVAGDVDAAGLAALCEAPSRALPVVVATPSPAGDQLVRADVAGRALAGLAHVVTLADDAARRAFNDAWGVDLLGPSSLVLVWPERGDVQVRSAAGLTAQGAQRVVVDVIEEVIAAAAGSLPELPRPRPAPAAARTSSRDAPEPPTGGPAAPEPHSDTETDPPAVVVAADGTEMVTLAELVGVLGELEQAWDRVDDLQSALAAADAMVARTTARADALESRIDDLVRAKVDLEIRLGRRPDTLAAASPGDALAQARVLCRHLEFAGDYRDIGDLSGIDPTALLIDLVTLDAVAAQWMSGDITDTTFALACRNVGLDFASGVSDTAQHEYLDDYAVVWEGRTVHALAHIRHGRGAHHYRIHVYLDRDQRRVVVGHVGRHLRGKRS